MNKSSVIRTKKAPVLWDDNNRIKAYYYGDKTSSNEAIWYTEDGKAYTLIYARLCKKYSFNPAPNFNK